MPFKKGQSGNPRGKPPGTKSRSTVLRVSLEKHGAPILAAVVKAAKGGDMTAARMILDRVLPPLRPVDLPATPISCGKSLAESGASIVRATLQGRIAPDAAGALLGLLKGQAELTEHCELRARIEALERTWREPS